MLDAVTAPGPGDAELAAMDRDGYLVVRGFFEGAELQRLLRWTEEVGAMPEEAGRQMVYYEDSLVAAGERVVQRIENFCPYHAGFDSVVRGGRLLDWSGALLGGHAVLFKEKINFKMPGGAGFKSHQDQQAGWTRYAPIFMTAMVTIDAATEANGCLEMVPGRNKEGLIGEEWNPLDDSALDLVSVPTAPGDVIFFDSYAPHASKPNLTDSPRRILYLTYNDVIHGDHRERYFDEKRMAFPPDVERKDGATYIFRV